MRLGVILLDNYVSVTIGLPILALFTTFYAAGAALLTALRPFFLDGCLPSQLL